MPVKWTTWRKGQILKRVQSIKTETGEKKKKIETGQPTGLPWWYSG